MNFDISKLGASAGQNKTGGGIGKPRFGPAVRARPKPAAKPAGSTPADPEPDAQLQTSNKSNTSVQHSQSKDGLSDTVAAAEPAAGSAAATQPTTSQATEAAPADQPEKEIPRFKPVAGKRKAAEPAGAAPAHEHRADGSPEVGLTVATTDSPPDDGDDDDAGPMTKAKKRKGMGKRAESEPRKPKTPLAELKIDAQTMNMKTVIKCANAKDRAKSNAAQLAKEAAAIGQGPSGRQQAPPPPIPEPSSPGAPQMIVDPETGNLILDQASLTLQAQPREEYTRREAGHHDLINSQTYMKRGVTTRWSPEETEEFWAGLAIFGNMPIMIAQRLNIRMAEIGLNNIKRTDKHVKNKIKKEHKANPRRVEALIAHQHAEPEDYAEVREGLDPAQAPEDEYLEAAPSWEGGQDDAELQADHQTSAASGPSSASAEPKTQLDPSAGLQSSAAAAKGPSTARARPRANPRPRVSKEAQPASLKAAPQQQQQQQQEAAQDEPRDRYKRMLEDANMTPEQMEEGVY